MSLFTLKDIWSYDCTEVSNNSFSVKSISVANIDNDPNGSKKVIIGGYSGYLRILASKDSNDSGVRTGVNCDLLAEFHLSSPILQVEVGYFIGASNKLHLAVLHPQKLGIYSVSKLQGQVEHGLQYKITLLYEHQLKRHAFNMCVGPFGQSTSGKGHGDGSSKQRDFMCIQSLDGTLSFFEQEVFSFSRYLPEFLLPGPIVFLPQTNSFITISSSWEMQCFRYSTLAMSKEEEKGGARQTEETSVGKKLSPEWICSIGEESIGDIHILSYSGNPEEVRLIIVTFRHFFCFDGVGEMIWCKRLDYSASCFTSFLNSSNEPITAIASGSDNSALYIYKQTSLTWAAKLPFRPTFISRMEIQNIEGGLLLLSQEGKLHLNVLGTEPSLFVAPPVQARDLDYEAAEKELMTLRQIIAEAGESTITQSKDTTVEVKVEFEGQKSRWSESTGQDVFALIATIKVVCHTRVNDVRVTIYCPKPIACSQPSVFIGDIVGRHNYTVEFYTENEAIPPDLQCEVHLFYLTDSGSPKFVQKCGIKIPLFIITRPNEGLEKDGDCKLTFSVNKPVLNVVGLYNDFDWGTEFTESGITFTLLGGEKITLLASTKSNTPDTSRYRIVSSSIAAIHLVFRDFMDRLQRKYGREKSDKLIVTLMGAENQLPLLTDYFKEIDAHLLLRTREAKINEDLAGRAAQLRAIQRRLLIRFRDKNALPLTQLETLLDGSIEQIFDALNFMDVNALKKEKSECRLSGGTKLMLELCLLQGNQDVEEISVLSSALCPYVWEFIDERGWEECVYTNVTHIRTQQPVSFPTFDQLDGNKLKKSIKSILEKVRKSALLPLNSSSNTHESGNANDNELLVGNEIVERMASARARTARRRPNLPMESIPEPADEITSNPSSPSSNPNRIKSKLQNYSTYKNSLEEGSAGGINVNGVVLSNNNNNDADDDEFW